MKQRVAKGKSTTFEHHQYCKYHFGEIKLKGKWHDGKTYIETYRPDGSLESKKEYERIITDFNTISENKNGTFVYSVNGKTFKDTFTVKQYSRDGQLVYEGAIKRGEKYGSCKSYFENGCHMVYKNNFEWDELNKDKSVIAKQRVWKNKSVYQEFWGDGTLKFIKRFDRKTRGDMFEDDFVNSSFQRYSQDGQLLEQGSNFEHHMIRKEFYDNGMLKKKCTIKTADFLHVLHGKYECFFENGQIKASGKYRHGKSSGIHKKWDSKGNLLFCGRFFDGILFGKDSDGKPLEGFIETYYEDETPQFKGEFVNGKPDKIVQIWLRAIHVNHPGKFNYEISDNGTFEKNTCDLWRMSERYAYKDGKRHIWKMSDREFEEWSETLWLDYQERWIGYSSHGKRHAQMLMKYFLSHGRSEGQIPEVPWGWREPSTPWVRQKKWNIEFLYTHHKDCTEVLIYWQLPLLEQYVGKISKSDFRNPCSGTQSKVWRYFNHYMQAYKVLDTDILTEQLFWKYQKDDLKHIVKTKKRLNNHLFLTLFIPKVSKFEEISYEEFHDQSLSEFFLYYDV